MKPLFVVGLSSVRCPSSMVTGWREVCGDDGREMRHRHNTSKLITVSGLACPGSSLVFAPSPAAAAFAAFASASRFFFSANMSASFSYYLRRPFDLMMPRYECVLECFVAVIAP